MFNIKQNKLTKLFLLLIYPFVFVHFLKDTTQDILRIQSPLDVFGDVKEDISFLPYFWQQVFYYGLGGLSFIIEVLLLIAIPLYLRNKKPINLIKWIYAGIIYLALFLLTCTLLDPRYVLFKGNTVSQSISELTQERPNCELQSNHLVSQPVNLLTNAAFLIASYLIYRLIRKNRIKEKGIITLFIGSVLIGLGSIAHHAVPNNFTLLLDGLPIYLFLFLALYHLIHALIPNKGYSVLLSVIYVFVNFLAPIAIRIPFDPNAVTPILNLAFLLLITVFLSRKYKKPTNFLIWAMGSYTLATVFFLLDEKICSQFPIGTHFLWHIFNAMTIYFLVRFIASTKAKQAGSPSR